jgi:hypothetical protein
MSVRAYKITRLEYDRRESFNLWHDDEIVEWLERNGNLSTLDDDSCGIIEISKEDFLRMKADLGRSENENTQEALKRIEGDFLIGYNSDYVMYYCF